MQKQNSLIGLTQFNPLQLSARPHQKTKSVSNNVDGKIKYQTLIYTRLQKNPKKEIKLGQSECPSCYTTALDVYLEHKQNQTIKLQIATFCKRIVLVQQHWPWPYPFCFFHNFTNVIFNKSALMRKRITIPWSIANDNDQEITN